MRAKINLRSKYFFFQAGILFLLLLFLIISLPSCKNNKFGDNTNDNQISSDASIEDNLSENNTGIKLSQDNLIKEPAQFEKAAIWGPINIFKGNVEELSIKDNTGVGSVSYDIGKKAEGTYLYALDVSNGKIIGDVKISGRCSGIDINEGYAFIWIADGINVYDLKKNFEFVQAILYKNQDEPETSKWISNLGSYLYVQDSKAPDYLIDKKTLEKVELNISNDDYIYYPLYPDCLIGDPHAFKGSRADTPAVYSIKEGKIIGYLPDEFTHFFAWDPQKRLFFYHDKDSIKIFSMSENKYISDLTLSDSEGYSIISNTPAAYDSSGSMNGIVITNVSISENGYYFLNGKDRAYVLDSAGTIKCYIEKSQIIGEFKGNIMFENSNKESLGLKQNNCSALWIKEEPSPYPGYHKGPHFTEDSIAWLCSCSGLAGHGDVIYQWNYETGSYLNYTEFTGYEVDVLSSDPFILAMRSREGGADADWYIVCCKPSELPFNLIPDIEVDYSPSDIYAGNTQVKFTCTVKNIPVEIQSQNISYEWDFGDGIKGTGKEVTHIYEKSGNYNLSVSVKSGGSVESSQKSVQIAVLETPDIGLIATPRYLTGKGITYVLECKMGKSSDFSDIAWDFGDGQKSKGGLVVSHIYKPGNYNAKVTLYNSDGTQSMQKEITINAKFPDFSITASTLEGPTALNVDFNCSLISTSITDSGLKYKWTVITKMKDGTYYQCGEVLSEKKSFSNVFVDPANYTVLLEIKDADGLLVKEQNLNIKVNPPVFKFSDEGRKIQSSSPIFIDTKYDDDKDGINQVWEDAAMNAINPYFELDEDENWLKNQSTDKVVNFVRVTPYPSIEKPKYILFYYCIAWSKDYGRVGVLGHNGDPELVILAWKVIDDKNLELSWVFTSAHGGTSSDHSGVWGAKGEWCNIGHVAFGPVDEVICASLKFNNNALKFYPSEDKHATYPTEECGEDVAIALNLGVYVGEDCGSDGKEVWQFHCYNAGEPGAHLMDDIGFIFPNERIWSGNKANSHKFAGGLECNDDCPDNIGKKLSDLPGLLKDKLD
jgi:PKD repeat protein